jgi:glycosyltransferase involved in cell wall biosynthesis
MISIIICSRDAQDLAAVSHNIEATIGTPYEIIAIDNKQGTYGICEAYNKGAASARYGIICFMHEDVFFHTTEWGKIVVDVLSDTTIGVLGVTGSRYQLAVPSPWWASGPDYNCDNVLNVFPDGHKEMRLNNPLAQDLTDVAVVDGLWLCSHREVWQKHPFDTVTFPGFHLYDLDYCAEIYRNGYRVCSTFSILLEHHSQGSLNDSWIHNSINYQKKRKGQLPFGPAAVSKSVNERLEQNALHKFTYLILKSSVPNSIAFEYVTKCVLASPLHKETLYMVKEFSKRLLSGSKK